jgi:acetylornithine deacetylase/succinyl-diaminopimelate desuccinylase-like protein
LRSLGLEDVYSQIDGNLDEYLEGLFEMLSQPSISTLGVGIKEMSELLRRTLEEIGFKATVIESAGHPFVYGEILTGDKKKPTVLIYGHYDVQPVEPLDAWASDPFKPTVREGRIYARGAGDNKGQLYAQLMGVKALMKFRGGRLLLNVKCIFEGEEENGSPNLGGFVKEHKDLLKADIVYTSDGPLHESGRPMLVFGVRGLLYVELTARGASRDLHSGNWGGPVPNPAWDLVRLLGTMKDGNGRVLIGGFYQRVRKPTKKERAAFRRIPLDRGAVAKSLGLDPSRLPPSEEFYAKLMAEPTLNICGIFGGYTGKGSKTMIPASASVKMDMRLVPDQEPDDIFRKLVEHVKEHGRDIEVKKMTSTRPSRTGLDSPYAEPIARAVRDATGVEPVIYPSLGATLPDYVFTQILGVPSIIVPYANIDESNHAPNENIKVENFLRGIKCAAAVLESLSRVKAP